MKGDMPESLTRGWDILNPCVLEKKGHKITLIGAGGIGSHVGVMLARMGIGFTVYDEDLIEEHNLSNQLYPRDSLGQNKAFALQSECLKIDENIEVTSVSGFYWNQPLSNIVISGLDSQEARKKLFEQIRRQKVEFYIDARMGGEVAQIFALDPQNKFHVKQYREKLNASPDQDPCTSRAIAYNLFLCAGLVGKVLQNYVKFGITTNHVEMDLRNFAFIEDNWS